MRRLSFKGYLKEQFKLLSGENTQSLYRLCSLSESNARLKVAVCMYLAFYTEPVLKAKLERRFAQIAGSLQTLDGMTEEGIGERLDEPGFSEYATVYRNYLYRSNRRVYEDRIKLRMLQRIRTLQQNKSVSNYRIYTALSLNHGNANAFLKNGDLSKLSLNSIRRMLAYVNGL